MSKGLVYTSLVSFVCPFCKLQASVGTVQDGSEVVAHDFPMCTEYEQMESIAYLIATRRALLDQSGQKPN